MLYPTSFLQCQLSSPMVENTFPTKCELSRKIRPHLQVYSFFFPFRFFPSYPSKIFLFFPFGSLFFFFVLRLTVLLACMRFSCIFSIKTAKRLLVQIRLCTLKQKLHEAGVAQFESDELCNSPHLLSCGRFGVMCEYRTLNNE